MKAVLEAVTPHAPSGSFELWPLLYALSSTIILFSVQMQIKLPSCRPYHSFLS